ncbi:MAG: ABC transporter substrate-binding protein [Proteobacteria bacterium]|nr:ABC transporter substrate-binding protein [Pseudomonadota bacterium]
MKRYAMETVVGGFVVIGIICLGYMTISLGKADIFRDDEFRLFARFTSVSGLRTGSPVEIYGIDAGSVESLSIDENKAMAVVEMKLKKGMTVYDDSSAAIKTAGLIGDKLVKFVLLYKKLLKNTYADRIVSYNNETIQFGKEIVLKANTTEVETAIKTDTADVSINYRMMQKDGAWRVYDVVIEGVSLINNYRTQFREILANNTPAGLIEILKKKVE